MCRLYQFTPPSLGRHPAYLMNGEVHGKVTNSQPCGRPLAFRRLGGVERTWAMSILSAPHRLDALSDIDGNAGARGLLDLIESPEPVNCQPVRVRGSSNNCFRHTRLRFLREETSIVSPPRISLPLLSHPPLHLTHLFWTIRSSALSLDIRHHHRMNGECRMWRRNTVTL